MQTSDHAPDGEVASGYTEDQAASEMLKRWGATDDQPDQQDGQAGDAGASSDSDDTQASADDQPQGDGQSDDQQSDAADEESGEVEIDVAGEKFKLPAKLKEHAERIQAKAKEVEAGATRKFQEAADLRKAAEIRAEQVDRIQKIAHAQADLLADHRFVMKRLAAYEQINVAELAQTDPQRLTQINAEYNQLTAVRQRLEQAYQKAVHDFDAETKQAKEAKQQSLTEFASKNIKGWGEEANNRLGAYLGAKGIEREAILNVLEAEPRLLLVLEDAAYGQKVRSAQPLKAQPTQKTLKPGGTASAKPATAQKVEAAAARLKKSGSAEDAAMLLLARSAAKRK